MGVEGRGQRAEGREQESLPSWKAQLCRSVGTYVSNAAVVAQSGNWNRLARCQRLGYGFGGLLVS
jgi:hypothetical protein